MAVALFFILTREGDSIMRNTIEPAVTWWTWAAAVLYFALAVSGAAWILGAWTTGGLVELLR